MNQSIVSVHAEFLRGILRCGNMKIEVLLHECITTPNVILALFEVLLNAPQCLEGSASPEERRNIDSIVPLVRPFRARNCYTINCQEIIEEILAPRQDQVFAVLDFSLPRVLNLYDVPLMPNNGRRAALAFMSPYNQIYKCIQNFLVIEDVAFAYFSSLTNVYRRSRLMQAARLQQPEDLLPNEVELINLDPPAIVEDLNQPPVVEVAEVMDVGDALVQPPNYQQILDNVRLEVSRIVETHFQCPVCLDLFRNPIMLVCQHSFCDVCWAGIRRGIRNPRQWKCPICRQIAMSLPVDFNNRQGRYPACRASPFQQVFDELNVLINQLRE